MTTPENLAILHKRSRHNRALLEKAKICGCFYCFSEFPFEQVASWADDDKTALCPRCGVDAVLGFDSKAADQETLHEMHDRWFGTPKRLTPEEWKNAIENGAWPPAKVKSPTAK